MLLVGVRPHHPHQGQALLRHAAGLREGGLYLGRYPGAPSIHVHRTKIIGRLATAAAGTNIGANHPSQLHASEQEARAESVASVLVTA